MVSGTKNYRIHAGSEYRYNVGGKPSKPLIRFKESFGSQGFSRFVGKIDCYV